MCVVIEDRVKGNVAKRPATERSHADIRRSSETSAEDLVFRRLDGPDAVGKLFPECLRHLGHNLKTLVIVEDVLDERPLQRVTRAKPGCFDAVAAVGAPHQQRDKVRCDLSPELETLVESRLVELEVLSLES